MQVITWLSKVRQVELRVDAKRNLLICRKYENVLFLAIRFLFFSFVRSEKVEYGHGRAESCFSDVRRQRIVLKCANEKKRLELRK